MEKNQKIEAQYMRHRPIAVNYCATSSLDNIGAWQAALSRTSKSRNLQIASDVLRTMLMHYGSCCASTSSIERRFSKMEKMWGTRQTNHSVLQLRDSLEVSEPISEAILAENYAFENLNLN